MEYSLSIGEINLKKFNNLLGYSLLLFGLLAIIIGIINNSKVINKEKALLTAENYIKNQGVKTVGTETISKIAISDDIYHMATKSQQWVVSINDIEDTWIFIDAYTDKINKVEKHEFDSFYMLPTEIYKFQKEFSWFLVLNYLIILASNFCFRRNKAIRNVFYISLVHFLVSILLFEIVSYIYMFIIIIIICGIYKILGK